MPRLELPEYENSDVIDIVHEIIHRKEVQQVLILKLTEGRTLQYIADELDRPIYTVRDWYYKNLHKVVDALNAKNS